MHPVSVCIELSPMPSPSVSGSRCHPSSVIELTTIPIYVDVRVIDAVAISVRVLCWVVREGVFRVDHPVSVYVGVKSVAYAISV